MTYRLRTAFVLPLVAFIAGAMVSGYSWRDHAKASETYSSVPPYTWKVVRILDGDTVEVDAKFFPPELGNIQIRVKGIDTPETGHRAKCDDERKRGELAKEMARAQLLNQTIEVSDVVTDKYGGRLVGVVKLNGKPYSDLLVAANLAVPYTGKTKSSWC